MFFTLKGTPFVYQGDELAMTNYPFQRMEDFDDIEAKNGYKADVLTGKVSEADYIANLRKMSRDNARTPMQWDDSANAGFTTGSQTVARRQPQLQRDQRQRRVGESRLGLSLLPEDDRAEE
jgi:oligo-1,6-glucosidase